MMTLKGKRKHLKIERAHTWHDPIKRLSFEYKNISIDLLFNKGDFFFNEYTSFGNQMSS